MIKQCAHTLVIKIIMASFQPIINNFKLNVLLACFTFFLKSFNFSGGEVENGSTGIQTIFPMRDFTIYCCQHQKFNKISVCSFQSIRDLMDLLGT